DLVVDREVLSQADPQIGMQPFEEPFGHRIGEHLFHSFEALVLGSQAISMTNEEGSAVDMELLRGMVNRDAQFLLKIAVHPKVVVAHKITDLYAHIGEFGKFSQGSGKAFGHHGSVLEPKIEEVAH